RLPKVDVQAVFKIRALFWSGPRLAALRPSEPLVENILEIAGVARGGIRTSTPRAGALLEHVGKIESAEAHVGPLRSARWHAVLRIEANLIVHLLLLRIAQNVVGFL